MSQFDRSGVVMDLGLAKRAPLIQFLRYWDNDMVGRHNGDQRLLKSFSCETNARPWVIVEARLVEIGGKNEELLLIVPVAQTTQTVIRGQECIPLYPDHITRFPAKVTRIRQMMATVALASEIDIYDWYDEEAGLRLPLYLDGNEDVWEEVDACFNDLWPTERRDVMFRMRQVAEEHRRKGASTGSTPSGTRVNPQQEKEPSNPSMAPLK